MDWEAFFAAQHGRTARPTLQKVLELRSGGPGFAIDLGCGEGSDTRFLLNRGWRVHAIDGSPGVDERVRAGVPGEQAARLTTQECTFERLDELPAADVVYSGFALPFCEPDGFGRLWHSIRESIAVCGWFAGELFGEHDEWFGTDDMNFHDRPGVDALLDGLIVDELTEDDRDGTTFQGPKHWHVFHVIAHGSR